MADGFDSAGESTAPVAANYATFGTKWGPSSSFGTSGGVVSWSLPATGTSILGSLGIGTTVTAFSNFLGFDFTAQLTAAFNAWSAVANISFIQVTDGGGTIGTDDHTDIRIGGLPMDGTSGTLAFGYFPGQGAISGEIAFDKDEGSFWPPP